MNLYTVLFINDVAVFVVMTYWFMLAKLKKRIDIVDIGWGTGFITLAISTFVQAPNIYTTIILVLVIIWGLRLVSHIRVRNHRKPDDPR